MTALGTGDGSVLVVKSLCDIIIPLLGNTTSLKCLVEDGKSVFTNCAAHVLQNLDVMHPVGYLINTAVQAHHTVYGCGTKTLLVMVGLWIKEAEILLDKGISLEAFIEGLQEAIGIVCKLVMDISCTVQIEKDHVQIRTEISECTKDLISDDESGFLEIEFSSLDCKEQELRNKSIGSRDREKETEQFETPSCEYHQIFLRDREFQATNEPCEKYTDGTKDDTSGDGLDEEIGWFFDNGKVPEVPSIDKAVCEKMDTIFNDFQNMSFPSEVSKESEQNTDRDDRLKKTDQSFDLSSMDVKGFNESKNESLGFSSLQKEESDSSDEFDACFEDVDVEKSHNSKPELVCNNPIKSSKEIESSEDEFDACFEDVEHFDSSEQISAKVSNVGTEKHQDEMKTESVSESAALHNISETTKTLRGDMKTLEEKLTHIFAAKSRSKVFKKVHQSRHFKSCINGTLTEQLSSEDKEIDESIEVGGRPSQISLEKKLADIMAKKTKSSRSQAMNKSRHFKTIESTVRSLNGELEVECNKTVEERKKEDDLETKLQEILAKKGTKNVNKRRVLNSSKHFKTFESSTAVYKDLLVNSNSNLQMDEICEKESGVSVPAKSLAVNSRNCNHGKKENSDQNNGMESSQNEKMDSVSKTNLQLSTQNGDFVTKVSLKSNAVTCLKSLCQGLSHGADEEMQFVHDILQKRRLVCTKEESSDALMDISQVHTVCMPNTDASKSCVLEGILAELTTDQMMMLSSSDSVQRNCLLINGDLKPSFTHIGFKQSVKTKVISRSLETKTKQQKWMEECIETIQELDVTAVLVKGFVDPDFIDLCTSRNIVICTKIPYKILQAVGETTKASIAVYLRECTMENVASGMTFETWASDWADTFCPTSNYTAIKLQGTSLHTVIFCHPSDNVVRLKEERFLHCLNRVLNSLKSKIVIPGRGDTEEYCYKHLMELTEDDHQFCDTQDNDNYRSAVFQSIAQGFSNYTKLLKSKTNTTGTHQLQLTANAQNITELAFKDDISIDSVKSASTLLKDFEIETKDEEFGNVCFDDYLSKVEAWKSSAHIVIQVLLSDIQIITGITDESRNHIKQGGNFIGII